jgi:hypothetical protein
MNIETNSNIQYQIRFFWDFILRYFYFFGRKMCVVRANLTKFDLFWGKVSKIFFTSRRPGKKEY